MPPRVAHAKPPGPKERKRERAKVGDNNGQATHGARKHAWRTQAAGAKINYVIGLASRAGTKKFQEAQALLLSMRGKFIEHDSCSSSLNMDNQTDTSRRTRSSFLFLLTFLKFIISAEI